jgi:hypothetical protein
MLETVSIDDATLSDIEVIELHDDPPFHKHMVGTVTIDGRKKFFTKHYNVNTPELLDSRLLEALHKFTKENPHG